MAKEKYQHVKSFLNSSAKDLYKGTSEAPVLPERERRSKSISMGAKASVSGFRGKLLRKSRFRTIKMNCGNMTRTRLRLAII
ncbi:hypothetical protein DXB23_01265 [Dorea sp. OM02-2LB]|nr:hypothetical protein DXB23_01265 [Dorea sp. OM02-2LB]RGV93354.1 hypothetical protein DWV97_14760 [Ruminococcus sp. AF14-10]